MWTFVGAESSGFLTTRTHLMLGVHWAGAQWAREEPKCAKTHVWGFIFYKSRGNVWISRDFCLNFITNIFSDV